MGDQHPACRLEALPCGRRWSVGRGARRKFLSQRELNAERDAIAFVIVASAQ
jgi:hypothetical protein